LALSTSVGALHGSGVAGQDRADVSNDICTLMDEVERFRAN